MTTQHIHPEHNDAEQTVVEHAPAFETTTPPLDTPEDVPTEVETLADEQEQEQPSLVQQPTEQEQIQGQEEEQQVEQEQTDTSVDEQDSEQQTDEVEDVQAPVDAAEVDTSTVEPDTSTIEPEPEPVVEEEAALQPSFTYTENIPLVEEEEIRPFTDFIEEFQQSEARFNAALREAQNEVFTAPASATPASEVILPWETPEQSEPLPSFGETAVPSEDVAVTAHVDEALSVQEEESFTAAETPVDANPLTPHVDEASTTPATAPVRPVSPLLRPASRLRVPRHGRHRIEEPPVQPAQPETPVSAASGETPLAPTVEPAPEQPVAPVEEPPRPARRYRFDRPAATTQPAPTTPVTPSAQPRVEEHKETPYRATASAPVPRPDNGQTVTPEREQTTKAAAQAEQNGTRQPSEQNGARQQQPVAQDATAVEAPAQEHERRRKHGERQRGKEQQQQSTATTSQTPPASVADVAAILNAQLTTPAVPESAPVAKEEDAIEDLPPLEYSEIQKANSRRRRRRHASSAASSLANVAKSAPAEVPPVVTPPPAVQLPRTPASTPTSIPAAQYTITSGYTVSQMNQEGAGPFMGPEPSPARGSIAAQNVRSIRTDVQRTPAYPVRTTEATSASVQQLASIVAQAVQTQTDRLVAELRRANQSPTNISVSLPPFPSNERVGVFVDVANLLYSARTLRMTVDFGKLLDFLRGNRRLVRAHAYCPTSPQPGDEQMFLQAVKGLGYRITTKNYKTFSSGAKKADLDLDLCMDVVRLVDGNAVDCIVLVSGDSDFMPMLDYCSDHGVRVEVAAFDEAMSATLRQSCDLFINLSMLEEIRA